MQLLEQQVEVVVFCLDFGVTHGGAMVNIHEVGFPGGGIILGGVPFAIGAGKPGQGGVVPPVATVAGGGIVGSGAAGLFHPAA